jgi:hypothetical protein
MLRVLTSFAIGLVGGYVASRAWWGYDLTQH